MEAKFYTPPTMSAETIQGMVNNYRENQLAAINEHMGIDDAHSACFDLNTLKNFIAAIENESKKINPELTDRDLGIRFYYAAYPQQENMETFTNEVVSDEYHMKHTLVMIPTIKRNTENGEIENHDFNPLNSETYHKTNLNNNIAAADSSEVMALNHGQLVPPAAPIVQIY